MVRNYFRANKKTPAVRPGFHVLHRLFQQSTSLLAFRGTAGSPPTSSRPHHRAQRQQRADHEHKRRHVDGAQVRDPIEREGPGVVIG